MRRRLFLFSGIAAASSTLTADPDDLLERWNRFAKDANAYVTGLNNGVVDVRMRAKVMREWESMTKCECW